MLKAIFFSLLGLVAVSASAQDVIVKNDNNTIVAKVKKIGTTEIEYVKYSNQNGPLYVIDKKDVKVINYENGSRDTFVGTDAEVASPGSVPSAANASLIEKFNDGEVRYIGKKNGKDAGFLIYQFRLTPESVIENEDLTIEIVPLKFKERGETLVPYKTSEKLGGWSSSDGAYFSLQLNLYNRTDRDIYIDLGTCNIIRNGLATSLYEQTVNSSTISKSVGTGTVTNLLGVGLGSGVAETNLNTHTIFNKRILQIPPHSKIRMPYMILGDDFMESAKKLVSDYLKDAKGYKVKNRNFEGMSAIGLKNGEIVNVENRERLLSVSCDINYGFAESGPFDGSIFCNLYLSSIIGTEANRYVLKFDVTEFPGDGFYFYFMNLFDKKTLRK